MTSTCRAARAVAQRRPDQQVHEQADRDPDQRVRQPRAEHAQVAAVAGQQDDERGGRCGGRLVAQRARRARGHRQQQHHAQRRCVDPEHGSGGEGEQHAQNRGADLLQAARERAVHGGVHGQQRRPWRQKRLRQPEDRLRYDPREHRRAHGLDDLQGVAPHHGVSESVARGGHRPGMPKVGRTTTLPVQATAARTCPSINERAPRSRSSAVASAASRRRCRCCRPGSTCTSTSAPRPSARSVRASRSAPTRRGSCIVWGWPTSWRGWACGRSPGTSAAGTTGGRCCGRTSATRS